MGHRLRQLEDAGLVALVGPVDQAEHLVHRHHQVVGDLPDQVLAPRLAQLVKEDVQGVGDELFVQDGEDAALEGVLLPGGVGLGDLVDGKGGPGAVRAAAQHIVAGDAVVVGGPDQKIQPAFPDALFVVGEEGLGHPQAGGCGLLAHPLFLSEKGQYPGKLRIDHTAPPQAPFFNKYIKQTPQHPRPLRRVKSIILYT